MNTKTNTKFLFTRKDANVLLIIMLISVLILSACGQSMSSATETPTSTFTPAPPTITFTPSPTPTPKLPVSFGTPYPSPSDKISTDNVNQVVELARWGKERGACNNDAVFSHDGKLIIVGTSLGIYFYDTTTLEEKSHIETEFQVKNFTISPDNKVLAVSYQKDNVIHLLNVDDGAPIRMIKDQAGSVTDLAFSRDGALLASSSSDGSIYLWKASDGSLVKSFSGPNGVSFLAFSPDSQILYSAGENEVIAYQVSDQKVLTKLATDGPVSLSADGNIIGVGFGPGLLQKITISTISDGKILQDIQFDYNTAAPIIFAMSPDAQYVAAVSMDYTVNVWKIGEDTSSRTLESPPSLPLKNFLADDINALSLSYSPDGQTLLLAGTNIMAIWNVTTGDLLKSVETNTGWILHSSLSPDGQTLATVENTLCEFGIRLWNLSDGGSNYLYKDFVSGNRCDSSTVIAYSSDGQFLAEGIFWKVNFLPVSGSGGIKNFDYQMKSWQTTPRQMTYSPDGQFIALRSRTEKDIYVFSVSSGKQVHYIPLDKNGDNYGSMTFSPDSKYFAAGVGALKLFEVSDWRQIKNLTDSIADSAYSNAGSAFSSDSMLFANNKRDKSIQLSKFPSMEPVLTLPAQTDTPVIIAFSADGTILASGADNGIIRLWNVSDGTLLREIKAHTAEITDMFFKPDGNLLITVSGDATIRLWGIKP